MTLAQTEEYDDADAAQAAAAKAGLKKASVNASKNFNSGVSEELANKRKGLKPAGSSDIKPVK